VVICGGAWWCVVVYGGVLQCYVVFCGVVWCGVVWIVHIFYQRPEGRFTNTDLTCEIWKIRGCPFFMGIMVPFPKYLQNQNTNLYYV
jgi:hypothetical protein